ncbi:MAG: MBL fold metallo-hydrolase [Planctomycetes bacterium]|nr:MBL fold metallo-hydrolase [Planctomycetota bacterium]
MKTHKFLISCLLMVVLYLIGMSVAQTITQVNTIYTRPDTTGIVNEQDLLSVHFIDVGGGDAILIDTPSDKKILIDGGWAYVDRGRARLEYEAYLEQYLGDDVVDLIIISHPDYDHFAGLSNVLRDNVVRQLWYSGYDSQQLSSSWRTFLNRVDTEDEVLFVSPIEDYFGLGSTIRFDDSETYDQSDDIVLTIINVRQWVHTTAYGSSRILRESQRRNSSSLVVRLDYGDTSFFFAGDTNGRSNGSQNVNACDDQELFMVRNNGNPNNPLHGLLDCTVLKVPHHGSDGSSSLRFLEAVAPEWAVISAFCTTGIPMRLCWIGSGVRRSAWTINISSVPMTVRRTVADRTRQTWGMTAISSL